MSSTVFLLLLVQAVQPPTTSNEREVVVLGPSLAELRAASRACVERRCPPDEDAAAALELAEAQFLAGDYEGARATVRAAIGRTRGKASAYPVPVSDLWRASARVAGHLGDLDDLRNGSTQAYTTLRNAFGAEDPRALDRQLDLGDAWSRLELDGSAERTFKTAVAAAQRSGSGEAEAIARLRHARMLFVRAVTDRAPRSRSPIEDAVAPLLAGTDPALAGYRFAARLILARFDERRGRAGEVDAVLSSLPPDQRVQPVLLRGRPVVLRREALGQRFDSQWVDMEFWITPGGEVADVQVASRSPHAVGDWIDRVATSIRSRRYSPSPAAGGRFYRLERYTLTAERRSVTGSAIRGRATDEMLAAVGLAASAATPPGATELIQMQDRTPGRRPFLAPDRR